MATGTAAPLPPTRQDPRQVTNTLKKTVNWNDPDIANGVAFANSFPAGAFILQCLVEVITTFNGTGPALTVGTVGTAYNNMIAAGDVDETTAAVTSVTRPLGRSLTAAGPVTPYAKLAVTGSPTQGQAVVTFVFEGGWAS